MAQDHLGLFDTPPDRQEVRFSLAVVGLMFGAFLLILPVRQVRWPEISAFIPVVDAIMFVGELITATLLYAQAAVFRSRALAALATGFVAAALLLIPHALTFPGAFAHDGLLGAGVNTTAWVTMCRRAAFPIAVILYVLIKRADSKTQPGLERPATRNGVGVTVAVFLAAGITLLATIGHDLLPPLFLNRTDQISSYAIVYQSVLFGLFLIATAMLFRTRKSVLDMWLLVALAGWLIETLLIITLHSRFTAGWYGLFLLTLFSHLVVMLALIAESNRLYARLAISTSALKREREARLMSMDGITAAISHEVGQPLSAVTTNATAGLNWLTCAKPDSERAIKALQDTIDAGRRSFDVIRSIRGMFAKGPGPVTQFSFNDLVRETTSLLDRELAAKKVSLELDLDGGLAPIRADRVQMQRVLINLLNNAIESLSGVRGRHRRIAIRSARLDGQEVLLDISDNGVGFAPEESEHIFDAFFTTKANGTGLGLSLCRTIIEEHGGRLWATHGEEFGATFQLRLPLSDT